MNIISYLNSRGIDTVDSSFYRRIEEWQSWYKARVKGFSFYRVYSGQGTYNKRRRKSLGMAKKVCEDSADLLLNEKVVITIDDIPHRFQRSGRNRHTDTGGSGSAFHAFHVAFRNIKPVSSLISATMTAK